MEFVKGTRVPVGLYRRTQMAGSYLGPANGLDVESMARANLELLLSRGVPPSVILQKLGRAPLRLCEICARERPPHRRTCSDSCRNVLSGRANAGRPKRPMTAEHREKIAAANKAFAAVSAKKIPRQT
jgi:predicted nucleic acid-binding Zn ribbon protein